MQLGVKTYMLADIDENLWTTLENNASHLSPFQTYSWAVALDSIGTEPLFFMLAGKSGPLAGLLMFKSHFFWGALHSYEAIGGPLLVSGLNEEILSPFASKLKDTVKERHGFSFYLTPHPFFNDSHFVEQGFHKIPSATFIIDLKPSLETLWGNLEGRARRAIRKSDRSEIEVIEARDWQDWDKFHSLYLNESLNKSLPPYSVRLHKAVYEHLTPKGQAKLFVARHDKKIIAGVVYLLTEDQMVFYRGASDVRYLKLPGANAIHWHVICWAKEKGIKYYDLGGAHWKPYEKHPLYGVDMFKRQWGGKLQRFYSYDLGKLYHIGKNLLLAGSSLFRLYFVLEKLGAIRRTDRI